jgi:hypothetical protein
MHLLKLIVKATGKKGLSQGGVISPLLSNLYLNEIDRMLERAQKVTRRGPYTYIEYARFADDVVILVDAYAQHDWLLKAVNQRLREELVKLHVDINEEKSRLVDLAKGESFGFLALSSAAYEACKANGGRIIRPSSSSAPHCCASSKTSSDASSLSQQTGWCSSSTRRCAAGSTTSLSATPVDASVSSKTGWRRRCGDI